MVPINNSDTAWLIVADYNQDNSKFHEDLREDVLNPVISDWDNISIGDDGGTDVGARGRISGVGGNHAAIFYIGGVNNNVGNQHILSENVGGLYISGLVGGHVYDPYQQ